MNNLLKKTSKFPAVGGNAVVSRGFDNEVSNQTDGVVGQQPNAWQESIFLRTYTVVLLVCLCFWLFYLLLPKGLRRICCTQLYLDPNVRNRKVRDCLLSITRFQPRRRVPTPPPSVLNVSLPIKKPDPIHHIYEALEKAESKYEEQLLETRAQRQFHKEAISSSIHKIEEAHSDHSQQLQRERDERLQKRKADMATREHLESPSVDAVLDMSTSSVAAEDADQFPFHSDHNEISDAAMEAASTLAGSISVLKPRATTATPPSQSEGRSSMAGTRSSMASPSNMSLNSLGSYDPLARPLGDARPSSNNTLGFATTKPDQNRRQQQELAPPTVTPSPRQTDTVRFHPQVKYYRDESAETQGKHPSRDHRVPGQRVLQETENRLKGNGVRLTAHGVRIAAKQVWIRMEGLVLVWQTERLVQGPDESYVWVRGQWRELPLASVLYLDIGKRTTALQFLSSTVVDADQCFSLLTASGSLDLQAHSKLERDAIVACLIMRMDRLQNDWRILYEESSHGGASSSVA